MKGAGTDHEVHLSGRHEDEMEKVEDEVSDDDGETDDDLGPLRLDDVGRPESECQEYWGRQSQDQGQQVGEYDGVEPAFSSTEIQNKYVISSSGD